MPCLNIGSFDCHALSELAPTAVNLGEAMTDGMVGINIVDPRVSAGAAMWRLPVEIIAVAAGGQHNLLLTEAGTVVASGSNERGQADVPRDLGDVVEIAAGYVHSLALRRDGTVVAWGNNTRGATNVPPGLVDVVAISAGGGHSAAVRRNGTVVVWGQLGSGAAESPEDLVDARSVASGWECCFAIRSDGTVAAWGQTQFGSPNMPDDLAGVVGIDGFDLPAPAWVAVKSDGTVMVGGSNEKAPDDLLTEVVQVAAGQYHRVALRHDGVLVGWGASPVRHTVPAGLSRITAVSAGSDHSLALRSDGAVIAWGKNGNQQLMGPMGSTAEFVAWDDGYYLPALTGRLKDPYEYGRLTMSDSVAPRTADATVPANGSSRDLGSALVSAIDREIDRRQGDGALGGAPTTDVLRAIDDYFYSLPDPDKQLWRDLVQKLWTQDYKAGYSPNLIKSKLIEVAGRRGWTSELTFLASLKSAPPAATAKAEASKSGCYIATAVYGSYDCQEVWILRRYRDRTLLSTALGRLLVRMYYELSPTAVAVGGPLLRKLARHPLDRIVERLRARGVSDAPYSD